MFLDSPDSRQKALLFCREPVVACRDSDNSGRQDPRVQLVQGVQEGDWPEVAGVICLALLMDENGSGSPPGGWDPQTINGRQDSLEKRTGPVYGFQMSPFHAIHARGCVDGSS